jgi:hypothetical protein
MDREIIEKLKERGINIRIEGDYLVLEGLGVHIMLSFFYDEGELLLEPFSMDLITLPRDNESASIESVIEEIDKNNYEISSCLKLLQIFINLFKLEYEANVDVYPREDYYGFYLTFLEHSQNKIKEMFLALKEGN